MATSVVTAVQARWAAIFNQAGDPELFFDFAPTNEGDGDQQRLPYAVLRDETGLTPEYFSDQGAVETGGIVIEIYAVDNLGSLSARAKWGGVAPSSKGGFDWFALSLTTSPRYSISLRRTNERWADAGFAYQSKRCHVAFLAYEVTVGVAGAGY